MVPLNFLNRESAADYCSKRGLKLSPATLATMAVRGGGPPFQKWGRTPVYEPQALDRWIAERLGAPRHSTSETMPAA